MTLFTIKASKQRHFVPHFAACFFLLAVSCHLWAIVMQEPYLG